VGEREYFKCPNKNDITGLTRSSGKNKSSTFL
jgi:hypothetical protein